MPKRILETTVDWARLKPEEFQWVPCVLCGSFEYTTLASLVINWSEFYLVRCEACDVVWRNPIPDARFLNDLYSEKYYNVATHSPALVYQVGIADWEVPDQNRRRTKTRQEVRRWEERGLTPRDEFNEPRHLLEIGGGRGYLQRAAAELGWSTLGLEISPYGIKAAIDQGLIMLPVTLEELSEKFIPYRDYFDTVVFFDFLEHIPDPGLVLRIVKYVLKEDGSVVLRIPLSGDCPKLHLIDHIWHFSKTSIAALLEREGFREIETVDSGVFEAPNADRIDNLTVFAKKGPRQPLGTAV